MARPRTPVGAHGTMRVLEIRPGVWQAQTLYRDVDGRSRQIRRVRAGADPRHVIDALEASLPVRAARFTGTT